MIKSKRKTGGKLQRNKAKRKEYDLVLIVCEDSKSSPNYFSDLVRSENLSTVNIEITGDCGSDPMSVVNHALDKYGKSVKDKNPASTFDRVYCVIDRDEHPNFNSALDKLNAHKNKKYPMYWVASYPCFEYWYLCHFTPYTKPIVKTGQVSSGRNCEKLLNIEWKKECNKDYDKGTSKAYNLLEDKIETAIINAKKTLKSAERTGELNPSTKVHELVEYLCKLKT